MLILLKSLKFYLLKNYYTQYILNIIYFIYKKKIYFYQKKINLKSLGISYNNLRLSSLDEIKAINNEFNDIHYIQSLRYLSQKNTTFFIVNVKSEPLIYFLKNTLNQKIILYYNDNKNRLNLKVYKKIKKKDDLLKEIEKFKKKNTILITDDVSEFDIDEKNIFRKIKIILSKKKLNISLPYNYYYDIFGKINVNSKNCIRKYFLYSSKKLIEDKNKNNSIISGIAILKNLDIYPFDICFESLLKFVDEFHLGIHKKTFSLKYKKILDKFLSQTKYRKKIKIHFHDFRPETTNNCLVRGRWIADGFNYLANKCTTKYIINTGADELYDLKLNKNFYNSLKKNQKIEEYIFKFYHFLDNLSYIRDPKFAAYNKSTRIFEKDKYISTDDGMGFRKINYFRPISEETDINIYHIGYLNSYKNKITEHFSKNGLFANHLSKKQFIDNMHKKSVDNKIKLALIKNLNQFKYMDGFKKIKKNIDKNEFKK